jgi:hypothetical protein
MRSISNGFWAAFFFMVRMGVWLTLKAEDLIVVLIIGPIFGKTLAEQHRKPKVQR